MLKRFIQLQLIISLLFTCKVFASPAFVALVDGINNRDYDMVNAMLLANSDKSLIKERDGSGRTALHYAAGRGNRNILSLILTAGANPNALDNEGQSPIFYAINKSYEDNTNILIRGGANVNLASKTRVTPLLLAAQKGKPKLADILIRAGADVNARSASGATPLMYAASRGNSDLVNVLLRNRAELRARDKLGNTAMHYAAKNNRNKVVKQLLPIINNRNNAGQTPLDVAALGGEKNRNVITELAKNGAKTGK